MLLLEQSLCIVGVKSGIGGLENQSYRTIELTLHTQAITLWNTVYIKRAIEPLK